MSPKKLARGKSLKLLSYQDVRSLILGALGRHALSTEKISVEEAIGRVCAEVVRSRVEIPDRIQSAMDGYAVRAIETRKATLSEPLRLAKRGELYPGDKPNRLKPGGACYVATGANIPLGADAVVRIEETRSDSDYVTIVRPVERWRNISNKGEDLKRGELLFSRGRLLSSSDIALLLSAGRQSVRVTRRPLVGVLSIGDELTTIQNREKDKTVNNYYHLVSGYVSQFGGSCASLGISKDNESSISESISKAIKDFDITLTIGGSSVGAKDLTIDAIASLNDSKLIFHGVRMVPIRPAGLAMVSGKPIVIMPANSISVALTFFHIVVPILNLVSGLSFDDRSHEISTILKNEINNERHITGLYLVEMEKRDGKYYSRSLGFGSNLIRSLSTANGFVEVGPGEIVKSGEEIIARFLGPNELSRVHKE